MQIEAGLVGRATLTVRPVDTAIALASGDVAVLATPRLLALCEEATMASLTGRVASESTSVGVEVALEHLAAASIGTEITATARVVAVDGHRITFSVEAEDAEKVVARGTVVRAIVDRARFS